ncbi:peptidylprolyl isomerase [candidate division KSB1 bacterium]
MKYYRIILTLCILSLLSSLAPGQQQQTSKVQTIDGIAAIVNKEIILHSDVNNLISETIRMNKIQLSEEDYYSLYNQVLESLISGKVEFAVALADTHISIPEDRVLAEVDNRINQMVDQLGSAEEVEKAMGVPIPRIREFLKIQTRENLYIQTLRRRRADEVTVTRDEIESFYTTYKDSLPEQEETFEIKLILKIPKPQVEDFDRKKAALDSLARLVRLGADFAELAKIHSEGPTGPNGGDLGWAEPGGFLPEFEAAVTALNPGEISDAIQTDAGLHIIQLIEKRDNSFHARHILKLAKRTAEDDDRVIQELNDLRQRAIDGEDFSDLSAEHSDDESIRELRGNLGTHTMQALIEYSSDIAGITQTLQEGDISEPFKWEFGYSILNLVTHTDAHKLTLVGDYETIKNMTLQDKQQRLYLKMIDDARREMFIDIKQSIFADTTGTIK